MGERIAVVGAGVVGLSIADVLASAGHTVTVLTDADTMSTVSAVSAAVWFPYRSERSPLVDDLMRRSFATFTELALISDAGVEMRSGIHVERTPDPDRTWMQFVPGASEALPSDLPPGALSGVRATVPVIVIPEYLPWLRSRVLQRGVTIERRVVTDLGDLADDADAVVLATGLRGGELIGGDAAVYPVQGQVARVANPGLTDWMIDDDNPGGVTYVIPRHNDVLVGGTARDGHRDLSVDPDIEADILARAGALVPAIIGQPIVGRAVGLRPARATLRLERVSTAAFPVIAAYGHGGAGVTLSWGTAQRVRELLD